MAASKDRIDRLGMLVRLIPTSTADENYPDPGRLLKLVESLYGADTPAAARRRAIQRDLQELVDAGRIEVVNPGRKPQRYRKCGLKADQDQIIWDYTRKLVQALIRDHLPTRRLDSLWDRLRQEADNLDLGPDKLTVISDSQRLLPAEISEAVLAACLEALAQDRALRIAYRDAGGKRTRPTIHPQGLVQRGPRLYVFALKNDEPEPVRMYALHRMLGAEVAEVPVRRAEGFSLQAAVAQGPADFTQGKQIRLVLRVRGYVEDLLRDCPLSEDQVITEEAPGADFVAQVSAHVPSSGQLLRWLLGCGSNVEVIAPDDLRQTVRSQLARAAAAYG